tara:strand:- start:697 stop:2064 length:1368 start_codon:yes stop_codon:yes gene_type:complete
MKLKQISINDLLVEDRAREQYGDIDELVASIQQEGLIQPLAVVEQTYNPDEGLEPAHRYKLLAGGRRFEACTQAGFEKIPVRIYNSNLSSLQVKSIELAENIYRKDFEWDEEVKLKKEIHELQTEIYGEKVTTKQGTPEEIGWSKRDTAALLNESPAGVTQDLQLADAIEEIPELGNAKNKSEAMKLVKKVQKDLIEEELAKRFKDKKASTPTEKLEKNLVDNFIIRDFFKGIEAVPDGSIDIVELDPPYGIDLKGQKKKEGNVETITRNYNEVDAKEYVEFMDKVFKSCYKKMATNSWMLCWFGPHPWFNTMHELITKAGFQCRMIPAIWYKGTGQTMNPHMYLANDYEMFFYARKGNPTISKQGSGNTFSYKPVAAGKKTHPTERPIEMIQDVLSTFGWTGARVLVPFLGSGNSLLSASNLGMDCFGFELSKQYKDSFIVKVSEQEFGKYSSI